MKYLNSTPNEVFKQILSLNSHKASGPDNISVKYIKTASEFISTTLCEIFNKCVIEGIFPNELKIAKVIPLYKMVVSNNQVIIDQFLYCLHFRKYYT